MIELRPGRKILTLDTLGSVAITQSAAAPAAEGDWWDPNVVGLPVLAAYRAKGAASYAASKVNLANPGTYDLTENNGAVPWTSDAGWAFVAAQAKALITGITPPAAQAGSMFAQYANAVLNAVPCGAQDVATAERFYIVARVGDNLYGHGGALIAAPTQGGSGNIGFAGTTAYRDGVSDGAIGVGAVCSDVPIIGGINTGGTYGYSTLEVPAVVIYAAYPVEVQGQAAAINAAMAAL